jgi:hypothetical protein
VVRDGLEQDALADPALDILVGGRAGRLVVVAVDALGVVLRLGVDDHGAAAGMLEGVVGTRLGEAEDDGVVVERLDLLGAKLLEGDDGAVGAGMQLVAVDDVGGGHGAPADDGTRHSRAAGRSTR